MHSQKSLFDLTSDAYLDGDKSAMTRDLIEELQNERNTNDSDGPQVTFGTLEATWLRLESIMGQKIGNLRDSLPLSTLRTIKTLYRLSQREGINLLKHIAPPIPGKTATVEFRSFGNAASYDEGSNAMRDLLRAFEVGLHPRLLGAVEWCLPRRDELLDGIASQDNAILFPIRQRFGHDDSALIAAYREMTEVVESFPVQPVANSLPMNEVFYTYVRSLELQHWAGELPDLNRRMRVSAQIDPIPGELEALCAEFGSYFGGRVAASQPMISITGFREIVGKVPESFVKAAERATGLTIKRKRITGLVEQARKVLYTYKVHSHRWEQLDTPLFSIIECVAAFCSILYQGQLGEPYERRYTGAQSGPKTVVGALEPEKNVEKLVVKDLIPMGPLLILQGTLAEYCAAFEGTLDRLRAYRAFNSARIQKVAEIFRSNDIAFIAQSLEIFGKSCLYKAEEIAGLSVAD